MGKDNAIGRSHGGLTTKIHAVVDPAGKPRFLGVSPGNVHDVTAATVIAPRVKMRTLTADKAYDSDPFRRQLRNLGVKPVIGSRSSRKRSAVLRLSFAGQ